MTSLLLIFRFPNPDRGILESFSKRQRRKDMLTNCQLIVVVSKRFHLMVSQSIVWYCMVFLHCMPTHLWYQSSFLAPTLPTPSHSLGVTYCTLSQLIYTVQNRKRNSVHQYPKIHAHIQNTNRNRLD